MDAKRLPHLYSTAMTKHAAALLRVSTARQAAADKYGLDVQRRAIRQYAEHNDFEIVQEYVDVESGSSDVRESFYRLLSEADRYDAVVFFDATRLARSEELSHRFIRLLGEANLEVHATNRGVIEAGLIASLDMAISAEEKRNIVRRLRGGVVARADANLPPQGVVMYGYTNIPKGKPVINLEEARFVRELYALSPAMSSYRELTRKTRELSIMSPQGKPWTHTSLVRLLSNTAYKGELVWPRRQSKIAKRTITIPAIVSPEVWQAAQKSRGPGRKTINRTPLSGHLKCGVCGYGMSAQPRVLASQPDRMNYRCNSRGRLEGKCGARLVQANVLDPAVDVELRRVLLDDAMRRELLRESEAVREPDPRLLELQARELSFVESFGRGDLTADEFSILRRQVRTEMLSYQRPENVTDLAEDTYRKAAETMELEELADFTKLTVIVLEDGFKLLLG